MPKGPKGELRPADVVGCAVTVAKIAIGEVQEKTKPTVPARAGGGHIGGRKRAKQLSATRRSEIAKKAAEARWERQKNN